MKSRPRIDIEGVALVDANKPLSIVAIFRHRTTHGLTLQMPEAGELFVPWSALRSVRVDLVDGRVHVEFEPDYTASQSWLRGATHVEGNWLDRLTLEHTPNRGG